MILAIVGVTGMVGREILEVLTERNFPLTELIPVASEKSSVNCENPTKNCTKNIKVSKCFLIVCQYTIFEG